MDSGTATPSGHPPRRVRKHLLRVPLMSWLPHRWSMPWPNDIRRSSWSVFRTSWFLPAAMSPNTLMTHPDYSIYVVHVAFWLAFGITQRFVGAGRAAPAGAQTAAAPIMARFSRTVLAVHFVAFGVMYLGIASAVFSGRMPAWIPGQRVVGTLIIAAGSAMMCWSLVYFRSWRFRAKLDAGHELATGGPYALVRHPIYAGMNLLALGTAVWLPTILTGLGLALMILGSDLRGRAEEHVLDGAFGEQYRKYRARTKRFLPGIY
jgi:protein-S-isoprenylcysteine O-methyltransferase Ste14